MAISVLRIVPEPLPVFTCSQTSAALSAAGRGNVFFEHERVLHCPSLAGRGGGVRLRGQEDGPVVRCPSLHFPFQRKIVLPGKDIKRPVLAVDLGLRATAVCSVVPSDGTVTRREHPYRDFLTYRIPIS